MNVPSMGDSITNGTIVKWLKSELGFIGGKRRRQTVHPHCRRRGLRRLVRVLSPFGASHL